MEQQDGPAPRDKIKLTEINSLLTCHLCKGYLIDATAISECLHSFCRSCIIKFLEENSYCPICEVLINKAKPNLKPDKTLQDIVYKLVPGLFCKEMMRRRYFYQKYPELAPRVPPEQRGEDTERTIFNPQDEISLSIEYISDDSTPGAIKVFCPKNGLDASTNLSGSIETADSQIKRYLQCPGMCRVEVLKKFVRNKYQVDTNKFYIDILYKRVPLPDHYTLIDIAYIYSWKRNEPMKFYFRITDLHKVAERFDYFDASKPVTEVFQVPVRIRHHHQDRERTPKNNRKGPKRAVDNNKVTASHNSPKPSHGKNKRKIDKEKPTVTVETPVKANDKSTVGKTEVSPSSECPASDAENKNKENEVDNDGDCGRKVKSETDLASVVKNQIQTENGDVKNQPVYTNITLNRTNNVEIITKIQKVSNKEGQPIGLNIIKQTVKKGAKVPNSTNNVDSKPSANVENNRIVPKLIIRTDADKKVVVSEKKTEEETLEKPPVETSIKDDKKSDNRNKEKPVPSSDKKSKKSTNEATKTIILSEAGKKVDDKKVKLKVELPKTVAVNCDEANRVEGRTDIEKSEFLKSIQLTARNALIPTTPPIATTSKPIIPIQTTPQKEPCQKRKPSSPIKTDKSVKKVKLDRKPIKKIILQSKTPLPSPVISKMLSNVNQNATSVSRIVEQTTSKPGNPDLQSLFDSCKINIPSSLSITLKEGNENEASPLPIPPVKNYIQILKLPDDEPDKQKAADQKKGALESHASKIEHSENHKIKRDEPFSREGNILIVKKLKTEPGVGKAQPILPSPVPELPCKLLNIPKDSLNKLNPRSPQTFQKIFEESIKKPDVKATSPDDKTPSSNVQGEPSNPGKKNILEIASQLYKKNKLEMEKRNETSMIKAEEKLEKLPNITSGKVAIPRLPSHRSTKTLKKGPPKFELLANNCGPQSYANLHSNALGLNYTVSIAQNGTNNSLLAPTRTIQLDDKSKASAQKNDAADTAGRFNVFTNNNNNRPQGSEKEGPSDEVKTGANSPVSGGKNGQLPNAEVANGKQEAVSAMDTQETEPSPRKPTPPVRSPKLPDAEPRTAQSSKPDQKRPARAPSGSPRSASASPSTHQGHPCLPQTTPPAAAKTPPQIKPATSTSGSGSGSGSPLNPNQLLEKYNIQNLAQLTASFNFNPNNTLALGANPQLAAIQQAMFLKHIEMQNRQNWFTMNQNHLLQYENYLKSLNQQGHVLGNIKEN